MSAAIEANIALADKEIAEKISLINKKRNLVIVLNGIQRQISSLLHRE